MSRHRQRRRRDLIFHAPLNDPANPLYIAKGSALTFARAHDATHIATYVHPVTGLVTAASADQLRIEANGALIEGARTNLATESENLAAKGPWYSNWTGVDSVITSNDRVAPDGALTADKVHQVAGPDSQGIYYRSPSLPTANLPYVFSVWVYAEVERTFLIMLGQSGGNAWVDPYAQATAVVPAGVWTRISVAGVACAVVTASSVTCWFYDQAAGTDFWVWGFQYEQGASASSYIPTDAAAMSRNADALTFPAAPGALTAIAKIDGTTQEINYAAFAPMDQHVRDVLVMNRTFSAGEIAGLLLG